MHKLSFLAFFVFMILFSCNQKTPPSQETKTPTSTTDPPQSTSAKAVTQEAPLYPSMTQEMMTHLWNNCTYVDYIFYTLPISMSMNNEGAIKNSLQHISNRTVPASKANCKAAGKIFYQNDGEHIAEADIFLSPKEDCLFFVFYEDKKPKYANLMSDNGINFFKNTLKRISTSPTGQ